MHGEGNTEGCNMIRNAIAQILLNEIESPGSLEKKWQIMILF
jgi:hypothetical protein